MNSNRSGDVSTTNMATLSVVDFERIVNEPESCDQIQNSSKYESKDPNSENSLVFNVTGISRKIRETFDPLERGDSKDNSDGKKEESR